jgi:hypothetical protein
MESGTLLGLILGCIERLRLPWSLCWLSVRVKKGRDRRYNPVVLLAQQSCKVSTSRASRLPTEPTGTVYPRGYTEGEVSSHPFWQDVLYLSISLYNTPAVVEGFP